MALSLWTEKALDLILSHGDLPGIRYFFENGIRESLIQVSFDQLGPVLSKLKRGNHPSSA
jgi:hypothetical protein